MGVWCNSRCVSWWSNGVMCWATRSPMPQTKSKAACPSLWHASPIQGSKLLSSVGTTRARRRFMKDNKFWECKRKWRTIMLEMCPSNKATSPNILLRSHEHLGPQLISYELTNSKMLVDFSIWNSTLRPL